MYSTRNSGTACSRPQIQHSRPMLERLRQIVGLDHIHILQIRDGTADLEHAVIAAALRCIRRIAERIADWASIGRIRYAAGPTSPLHVWSVPASVSAQMDVVMLWTTSSSSASGGPSNTRRATYTATPPCPIWGPDYSAASHPTMSNGRIRA